MRVDEDRLKVCFVTAVSGPYEVVEYDGRSPNRPFVDESLVTRRLETRAGGSFAGYSSFPVTYWFFTKENFVKNQRERKI